MKIDSNYSITVGIDGNRWFAMIGPNLHEGEAGFGRTLPEALRLLADDLEKINLDVFFKKLDQLGLEHANEP